VEVLEGQEYVGGIEGRILKFESLTMTNVEVEFAAHAIVEHEVETLAVLEGVFQLNDKWVLRPLEDAPFGKRVAHLPEFSYVLLL